jgi:hypothetical protein
MASLAGQYDNPMTESALSPQSGTLDLATDQLSIHQPVSHSMVTKMYVKKLELLIEKYF